MTLYDRARGIATHLRQITGHNWMAMPPKESDGSHFVRISLDNNLNQPTLSLNNSWGGPNKFNVNGHYPSYRNDTNFPYRSNKPDSINCSSTRTDESIAKDIANRFIPAYLEAFQAAKQEVQESKQYHDRQREQLNRLATLIGEPTFNENDDSDRFTHYESNRPYVSSVTTGLENTFNMEFGRIPLDLAEKLIRLVQAYTDE